MRPQLVWGFESGDAYDWTNTGSGVAVNGTGALTGSYGLDCNVPSGSAAHLRVPYPSYSGTGFVRRNVKFSAFPASRRVFMRLGSATAAAGRPELAIASNGDLSWGANNAETAVLANLSSNHLYCLEWAYDNITNFFAVRLNETVILDWTSISSQSLFEFVGGIDTVAATFRFSYDDGLLDIDEWPGEGRVKALTLSLSVDNAGWTPNTGSSKVTVLNETPPDDDTTYLLSPNTTGSSTDIFYSITIPSDVVTVRAVQPRLRGKRDGASNGSVFALARDKTLTGHIQISAAFSVVSTYGWSLDSGFAPETPWGPGWTLARLQGIEYGIRNNSANKSRITSFLLECAYDTRNHPYEPVWPLMLCGFETGDFAETGWRSGAQANAAVSTSHPRSGSRSVRINPASGAQSRTQFVNWSDWWSSGQVKEQWLSFWIYVDVRQASGNIVLGWMGNCRLLMNASGGLLANSVGDSQTSSATPNDTIPLDTLTHVAVQVRITDGTGNNGWIKVWVNDVLVLTLSSCNPGTSLSSTTCGVGNNVNAPSANFDAYYDDVVLCLGRRPRRDDRLDTLSPSDVGEAYANANWTAVGDTTIANTTDDGATVDDDTTYALSPNNTTDRASVDLANGDSASQQVFGMMVLARIKRDGASGGTLNFGVVFENTMRVEPGSTTSGAAYTDTGTVAFQHAKGRWDPAFVDAVEFALRSNSTNKTRITRVVAVAYFSRAVAAARPKQLAHGFIVA